MNDAALRSDFINGMSHAACTVNIVTTDGVHGKAGVTVSAMSSVSADTPQPTMLVCVHHLSPAAEKILGNGVFCVNLLRDDQSFISDAFAGRFKEELEDKFDCADWATQVTGAPRVVDPLVAFDCRMTSHEKVGTHYVFLGEVEDVFIAEHGSPLIYANRAYGSASRFESVKSLDAGRQSQGGRLSLGCVHTFGPFILPGLIAERVALGSKEELSIQEGDQRRVLESLLAGETEIAFLYDLDLPEGLAVHPIIELTPYVLLAEGHPLSQNIAISPEQLNDYPMVLLDVSPSREYFTSILEEIGVTPQIGYRPLSFEMVRGLVGHGLGYTLLATKPASAMTYDGKALVTKPLNASIKTSSVALVHKSAQSLSSAAQHFLEFCTKTFTE